MEKRCVYTETLTCKIIKAIRNGASIDQIKTDFGVKTLRTVKTWIFNYYTVKKAVAEEVYDQLLKNNDNAKKENKKVVSKKMDDEAEKRIKEAEKRAEEAQKRAEEAQKHAEEAQMRAEEAQMRAKTVEKKLIALEGKKKAVEIDQKVKQANEKRWKDNLSCVEEAYSRLEGKDYEVKYIIDPYVILSRVGRENLKSMLDYMLASNAYFKASNHGKLLKNKFNEENSEEVRTFCEFALTHFTFLPNHLYIEDAVRGTEYIIVTNSEERKNSYLSHGCDKVMLVEEFNKIPIKRRIVLNQVKAV